MTKITLVNWKLVLISYILIVLAFSFSARANDLTWMPSDVPSVMPKNMRLASGELALDLEGNAYLVTASNEVFELVSENLDLSELNGVFVQVKGFEPRYSVGPAFKTHALLPLLDEPASSKPLSAPVLVVVSVRVIE